MLDAMLRAAGLRTGLYTSPHLVDFRERIRVDGRKIPPQAVAEGLTILREISFGWDHSPTFFEIATALALWHFAGSVRLCRPGDWPGRYWTRPMPLTLVAVLTLSPSTTPAGLAALSRRSPVRRRATSRAFRLSVQTRNGGGASFVQRAKGRDLLWNSSTRSWNKVRSLRGIHQKSERRWPSRRYKPPG